MREINECALDSSDVTFERLGDSLLGDWNSVIIEVDCNPDSLPSLTDSTRWVHNEVDSIEWYSTDQKFMRLQCKVDSLLELLTPKKTFIPVKLLTEREKYERMPFRMYVSSNVTGSISLEDIEFYWWSGIKEIISKKGWWTGELLIKENDFNRFRAIRDTLRMYRVFSTGEVLFLDTVTLYPSDTVYPVPLYKRKNKSPLSPERL